MLVGRLGVICVMLVQKALSQALKSFSGCTASGSARQKSPHFRRICLDRKRGGLPRYLDGRHVSSALFCLRLFCTFISFLTGRQPRTWFYFCLARAPVLSHRFALQPQLNSIGLALLICALVISDQEDSSRSATEYGEASNGNGR